jgi:hypothetical protein
VALGWRCRSCGRWAGWRAVPWWSITSVKVVKIRVWYEAALASASLFASASLWHST